MTSKPPLPPFTLEKAIQKARMAENAWNGRDPQAVALAYTEDSHWRNRSEFITGRGEILRFLERKWARELDYKLIKEVWAFTDNRIASSMSGMTIQAISTALMATKTGSSQTLA
jgi:nuclear transport factor 2 (NTF2) superfamily protein